MIIDLNGLSANGGTIKTASGVYFDFNNPSINTVKIDDIATALSKICRFGGQIPGDAFYSVAEHSILCVKAAMKDGITDNKQLLAILLHDATEAYCGDVIKPLKVLMGDVYSTIEKKASDVIGEQFSIDFEEHHDIIKKYDIELLIAEKKFLFNNPVELWNGEEGVRIIDVKFKCYKSKKAKKKFLAMFRSLYYIEVNEQTR